MTTEQTILRPSVVDFSENIRELNILDFRKTLVDLAKFGKDFVLKNYHAEEKDKKFISNTI